VVLGSTDAGTARRFTYEHARHSGLGLLQCEATTRAAWFNGRPWGNDDESALDGSMARSQAGTKKENDARGKGGNNAHCGAVV
jgi:hypothetical protein